MKKKLLLLLLLFISTFSKAQLKFGVKLGVLATDVNVNATSSLQDLEVPTTRKINYSGGVVLDYEFLPDLLGLRTGIEYAQKGYNVNINQYKQMYNDIKEVQGDWSVALRYLQLPVNIYYKLGNFNINAGPYMAYGLGGLEKYNLEVVFNDDTTSTLEGVEDMIPVAGEADTDLESQGETMLINYFNKLDYGINLGLGFSVKNIQLNVQYQQGLKNITPDLVEEPNFKPSDLISKNNVLSFEVIYLFSFGKDEPKRPFHNKYRPQF